MHKCFSRAGGDKAGTYLFRYWDKFQQIWKKWRKVKRQEYEAFKWSQLVKCCGGANWALYTPNSIPKMSTSLLKVDESIKKSDVQIFSFEKFSCRSTSERLTDSRSLNRRTNQARRQQTKNSRQKTSYSYIALFSSLVQKWYVVITYQPHAHTCISCKRYVVLT